MASAIDSSKPEDGVPAKKADLRANLEAAKIEIDHGGFAEGFAPANYGPPATSRVRDHLSAIDAAFGQSGGGASSFTGLADTPATYAGQATRFVKVRADETGLEFAPAPGGSGGLTGWVDVKADYGAVGNGSTNDTTALQNALSSGASVVYFPAGVYLVSSQLTLTPGTKIVGAGAGNTVIDASGASLNDAQAVFNCAGTTVSLPALSSSIAQGAGSIAYASSIASNLNHGDWIRIVDTTTNSFDGGGNLDGFTCMVQSAESSTLYPAQPSLRTLPAARTSGSLSNVQSTKLDRRGLVIEDLTICGSGYNALSDDSSGTTGSGIYCLHLANVYITRVRVLGGGSNGVSFERSANCHVTDCDVTVHTGNWNNVQQYALHVRGSSYVYMNGSNFFCPRHAVDISGRLGTAHTVIVMGCTIGAPGTNVFLQPNSTVNVCLDWHAGCFHSKVVGCYIQGSVTLRGTGMEIIDCTLENGGSGSNTGMIDIAAPFGPALDFRMEGCKVLLSKSHFSSGMWVHCGTSDWVADNGAIGSLVIANNDIYVMLNSSDPLINIQNTASKSPATGVVHIMNNRIGHKVGGSTQPLCNVSITDGLEAVVSGNVLPANMTLGTVNTFTRKVLSPNVIGGQVVFSELPTSSPGGSGRLWNDGGTLKVT